MIYTLNSPFQPNIFQLQQSVYSRTNAELKGQEIIRQLVGIIYQHKSTVDIVFGNYKKFDDALIDIFEFGNMLRQIDQSLEPLDIQVTFKLFDIYSQGKITFRQFRDVLVKHAQDIIMREEKVDANSPQQQQQLQQNSYLSNELIKQMSQTCQKFNTNLKKLFTDAIQSGDKNYMNIFEFGLLIKQIQPNANEKQIEDAFNIFDNDLDRKICFKEFENIMNLYNNHSQALFKLIQAIKFHKMDLPAFFALLKKNDTELIDINAFAVMLRMIENGLNDQEIELAFRKFDLDGDRHITFKQFKEIFERYYYDDIMPHIRADQTIARLVQIIRRDQVDLQTLFNTYDKSLDTQLDLFEFGQLLRQIDNTLTEQEIEFTFNKFDINRDRKITFKEFCDTVQIFYQIFVQPHEKKNQAIIKLTAQIMVSGQNIQTLFNQLDTSGDKNLDVFEFGSILKKIDVSMGQSDIELAFREFDANGDRAIQFNEFQDTLQRIYKEYLENQQSKDVIKKLVGMIQTQNIDLTELFKQFDQSGDMNLDIIEFGQLLRQIDPQIVEQEIQKAFTQFDFDGNGNITFSEFQETLQKIYLDYTQIRLQN